VHHCTLKQALKKGPEKERKGKREKEREKGKKGKRNREKRKGRIKGPEWPRDREQKFRR